MTVKLEMLKLEGKGTVLHSQGREIVLNVYNYFYNSQDRLTKLKSAAIDKAVEAIKVKRWNVERILHESSSAEKSTRPAFSTPRKNFKRKKYRFVNLILFDLDAEAHC